MAGSKVLLTVALTATLIQSCVPKATTANLLLPDWLNPQHQDAYLELKVDVKHSQQGYTVCSNLKNISGKDVVFGELGEFDDASGQIYYFLFDKGSGIISHGKVMQSPPPIGPVLLDRDNVSHLKPSQKLQSCRIFKFDDFDENEFFLISSFHSNIQKEQYVDGIGQDAVVLHSENDGNISQPCEINLRKKSIYCDELR